MYLLFRLQKHRVSQPARFYGQKEYNRTKEAIKEGVSQNREEFKANNVCEINESAKTAQKDAQERSKLCEYHQRYHEEHKEARKAYKRQYYLDNRLRILNQTREYDLSHKEQRAKNRRKKIGTRWRNYEAEQGSEANSDPQ
jgi:hypothetical protein